MIIIALIQKPLKTKTKYQCTYVMLIYSTKCHLVSCKPAQMSYHRLTIKAFSSLLLSVDLDFVGVPGTCSFQETFDPITHDFWNWYPPLPHTSEIPDTLDSSYVIIILSSLSLKITSILTEFAQGP